MFVVKSIVIQIIGLAYGSINIATNIDKSLID